ncbi:MAG: alanine--tRNA ligase [Chitinispirillaceae bacterium]|nr:alanine--tRNA ligase [Chitinispirillaceae bacterium]
MKTSKEIRDDFLGFFKKHDHVIVPSAPVVPQDDPTLLFTNAGMNQFKSIFLGDNPKGLKRAADTQKCMRVSGKHNDLEEVGRDHYHHTFFEMLGNWSFGDYYKKEAIRWAWELLTCVWKLEKDRLFVTVYDKDDEAAALWESETDVQHDRIRRFGEAYNFWEMGETGPCGPCSEVHYDTGDRATRQSTFADPVAGINGRNARYRELWNLVFIQYNRENDGNLVPLKARHVDTGMGFERVVSILQGADSNYHTDLFMPVIKALEKICSRAYKPGEEGTPFRVAADHVRALVFAITDGVFPSNEGRGYVVRRILRRAARFGREIGCHEPFLHRLVPEVIETMAGAFPEINDRRAYVEEVIRAEEERFGQTLEQGIQKFHAMVDACQKLHKKVLAGSDVFSLYDTYGFPLDLTRLMAAEKDLSVDEKECCRLMEAQKKRGREARKGEESGLSPEGWTELAPCSGTAFVGYEKDEAVVNVCRYKTVGGECGEYLLVLDRTPFYAASGGQVGDLGTMRTAAGKTLCVIDTLKWNDLVVHRCRADAVIDKKDLSGELTAFIGGERRAAIRRNHSATHLLQAALRQVLGTHVQQSGSRVDERGLRFDFTHFKALGREEIEKVEELVNGWILDDLTVDTGIMEPEKAKKQGAMALFGEKYGDRVRVVSMGGVSKELCGGTHVSSTGKIGLFHITEETSISAGVRRIEAVTGMESVKFVQRSDSILSEAAGLLKAGRESLVERVKAVLDTAGTLEAKLAASSAANAAQTVDKLLEAALAGTGRLKWNVQNLGIIDKKDFGEILNGVSDAIRRKNLDAVAVVLAGAGAGAVMLGACAGSAAVKVFNVHCGEIVKAAAAKAGGSGGGSAGRAQAGGKDPSKIGDALAEASRILGEKAVRAAVR